VIRRREIISLLGGAAAAWPLAARAQGDRVRRVGVFMATIADEQGRARFAALTERLREFGWVALWPCRLVATAEEDRLNTFACPQ
jgi:hypothetical protein